MSELRSVRENTDRDFSFEVSHGEFDEKKSQMENPPLTTLKLMAPTVCVGFHNSHPLAKIHFN